MPKPPKRRVYLVSVLHEQKALQVYAVLAGMRKGALDAIASQVPDKVALTIVGGLSRDLGKQLQLELGQPQLIHADEVSVFSVASSARSA